MAIVHMSKFVGKAYLFSLAFCLLFLGGVKAQTSNPVAGSFTSCSATSQTCSFGTVNNNNVIKATIVPSSLTSTQATFEIQKCSGNFTSTGTMYVKSTVCGNSLGNAQTYSIGASTIRVTVNHGLNANQTGTFYATITADAANNTKLYYYAGPITITMPPPATPNLQCGTVTISPNPVVQGQAATFAYRINNTGQGAYSGTLRLMLRNNTQGYTLDTYSSGIAANGNWTLGYSTQGITAAAGAWVLRVEDANGTVYCSTNVTINPPAAPNLQCGTVTISPNPVIQGQAATFAYRINNTGQGAYNGTLYLMLRNNTQGYTLDTYSSGIVANGNWTLGYSTQGITAAAGAWVLRVEDADGTVYCTQNITINPPAASNLQCSTVSVSPNPVIRGQSATFSYRINNIGTGAYSGTLRLMFRNNTQGFELNTHTSGIAANGNATLTYNNPTVTAAAGAWVLRLEDANETVYCSTNVTVQEASTPNLQCGTVSVSPNPVIRGQSATFSYRINNTGTGAYNGALRLMFRNNTQGFELATHTSGIAANGNATLTYNNPTVTAAAGAWVLRLEDANETVYCSTNVTVQEAAATTCSGCVTWSGGIAPSSTNEVCLASNDLCTKQIIISGQNATNNATKGILRKDLAVLVFKALFGSQTATTPADNFPVPFADMRAESNANRYWFKAAKALAYLQFSDDRTPFDRTFINFRPNDSIARIDALKMIMEAWNIRPDASDYQSAATFCDVTADKINFAYVQKAARLGIIGGNSVDCPCTNTPKCFKPRSYMTRNQAFIIIYRLINKLAEGGTANPLITDKPSNAQLQSVSNYFVPTNYTLTNAAQTMGIEQANFNHYTKSSFSIGGRGLPLTFEHSYNSFLTEMPDAFFEGKNVATDADVQTLAPLGIGWSHTYSSYILKVDDYIDYDENGALLTQNPKLLIAWSNGSFQAYDRELNAYDTEGVYDNLVQSTSGGTEYIRITSKDQMTYEFISSSAIKFYYLNKITDRNNNGLLMVYDGSFGSQRRLTEVYEIYANNTNNATRRKLVFSYNGSTPYLSSVKDNSINRTINFNVNATTKNLESFTDAKMQTSNYAYPVNASAINEHLLTSIQLPKGNTVTNTYLQRKLQSTATNNSGGRQSKTTVGLTPNFSNTNEFTNSSVAVTQGGSTLTTNYKHDDKRRVKSATTPTTSVAVSAYGTGSNVFKPMNMRVTGAGTTNGSSVAMTYDPKGNPLTVIRTYTEGGTSRNLQETFTYNTLNDITSHTDARGNSTTFEYLNGNLLRVIRPLNSITEIANRNAYYQVTSVRNPENIVTNYAFDDVNGNLSNTTIQGTTISTSATYDNASRVKTVTDPAGKMTKVDYDPNDNVTKETDARNAETTYSYDRNDNLLTITNALQQVTTFGYSDAEDFLMTETFGGHTKTYDYNQDGSLKSFVRGNRSFAYTYDTKGRLETDGQVRLTYDDRNRIATATYQNRVTTYFYDDLDRMTAYEYTANGKTDRVEYTYDNNSNVQTIKYPNNRVVTYAYDALNRMETVTDWNNRIVARYDYKLDGRMNFVVYNNGVKTTYAYDNAGRVNGMTTKKSTNVTLTAYTFGLDNVGNHTSEEMTEPLLATGLATLGNKNITNPAYSFNRMSQYDDRTFTHDGQGNISTDNTTTNTFDNYDNLTGVTGANPMTAEYDAGGNRRNLNQNNQNTRYVLDILGMSKVLMETEESTGAVQHYYIYGANGLICRLKPDATTTHYYHADFRGSIVAMTDANQNITHKYAYDPFGSLISKEEPTSDSNPFRYVGQYGVMQDATNRYFMRARYYDPSVGRFISEDPIAAANLYPYAGNNPINWIDPLGTKTPPVSTKSSTDVSAKDGVSASATVEVTGIKKEIKSEDGKVSGSVGNVSGTATLNLKNDPSLSVKLNGSLAEGSATYYANENVTIKVKGDVLGGSVDVAVNNKEVSAKAELHVAKAKVTLCITTPLGDFQGEAGAALGSVSTTSGVNAIKPSGDIKYNSTPNAMCNNPKYNGKMNLFPTTTTTNVQSSSVGAGAIAAMPTTIIPLTK